MRSVLLIEDDKSLGATLTERLGREGYQVTWAASLKEAAHFLSELTPALAIVDINLPDGTGWELVPSLRARAIPFLFLTAASTPEYRLQGYELGALEFIPKPFHLKELLLRVKRVLDSSAAQAVSVGQIKIDFSSMSLTFGDGTVERPNHRDMKLLRMLISSSPRVISREEILRALFPANESHEELPTPRTIDNSIVRLRQLLRRGAADFIRSVRSVGYQWEPGDRS